MIKIIHDNSPEISFGLIWAVRVVQKGEQYGLNMKLTHDQQEPLVEFYDCRYEHTDFGQFVSRYNLTTLLAHDPEYGLDLQGDVPAWSISTKGMQRVTKWLISKLPEMRLHPFPDRKAILMKKHPAEDRYVVLCWWEGKFVTWKYYDEVGGFYLGHYHEDFRDALKDYEERLAG